MFPSYVMEVVPVVHYCMGGLKIDEHSRVLSHDRPIPGLFAAGEVTGEFMGLIDWPVTLY